MASAKYLIQTNNFNQALYQYNNARANWKEHWWKTLTTIYYSCEKWAKKYILDPINKIVKRVINELKLVFDDKKHIIECTVSKEALDIRKACYLFKFYNEDKFVFSKIGETTVGVKNRASAELKEYKKKHKVNRVVIEGVFDCKEYPTKGFESNIRSALMPKYWKSYVAQDRFFCDIPVKEFNTHLENFMAQFA